jgi:hypothetical protein
MSNEHPDKGWSVENGAIYHFDHVDRQSAENQLEEHLNLLFAIEAVHHPLSDPNHPAHKKTFLVWGYHEALLKAVQIQGAPYPEDVLAIRLATPSEIKRWLVLADHYANVLRPEPLTEQQVDKIVGKES